MDQLTPNPGAPSVAAPNTTAPAPVVQAAPAPVDSTPPAPTNVEIVAEALVKSFMAKMDGAIVKNLEKAEREGKHVVDPRQDPNFRAVRDTMNSPFGATVVAQSSSSGGLRHGIREALKHEFFTNWKKHQSGFSGDLHIDISRLRRMTADVTVISDLRDVGGVERISTIDPIPMRSIHVRDLMSIVPTSEGAIHFLQQTGFTNNADIKSETTNPDSPNTLNRSKVAVAKKTKGVKTIGHYIAIPRETLDDVDGLAELLEMMLIYGILLKEDSQLLRGDGIGDNFSGLMVNAACQTHVWSDGDVGDNQADAILEGMAKIWIAELMPEGTVLHPTDAKNIIKLKDGDGNYLFPQMQNGMLVSLWGLPVSSTTAQEVGVASTGAFRSGAKLRERETAAVRFSQTVGTQEVEGQRSAIGEERMALEDHRPEAFAKVTLNTAPVAGS